MCKSKVLDVKNIFHFKGQGSSYKHFLGLTCLKTCFCLKTKQKKTHFDHFKPRMQSPFKNTASDSTLNNNLWADFSFKSDIHYSPIDLAILKNSQ